jgi:hypothetical protein
MSTTTTLRGHPETFRLPRYGERDPYFGLTRNSYYFGESQGWWKLVRLIAEGKEKGITLVPFAAVAAHIYTHGITSPQNSEQASAASKGKRTTLPTRKGAKP